MRKKYSRPYRVIRPKAPGLASVLRRPFARPTSSDLDKQTHERANRWAVGGGLGPRMGSPDTMEETLHDSDVHLNLANMAQCLPAVPAGRWPVRACTEVRWPEKFDRAGRKQTRTETGGQATCGLCVNGRSSEPGKRSEHLTCGEQTDRARREQSKPSEQPAVPYRLTFYTTRFILRQRRTTFVSKYSYYMSLVMGTDTTYCPTPPNSSCELGELTAASPKFLCTFSHECVPTSEVGDIWLHSTMSVGQ